MSQSAVLERPDPLLPPSAAKRPRLSLCMIAKNEERFLRNCLESARGVADEIVLVDTGSTDATREIALEFGAKLIEHPWNDDFSEARNISLRHATGDWVLWLDADEEIAPGCQQAFRDAIENAPENVGAYLVRLNNWMTTLTRVEGSDRIVHRSGRLFRRAPGVRFVGRIHEQNMPSLIQAGYEVVNAPQLVLDHFGYVSEICDEKQKSERTVRLLTREIEECPVPEMHGFQCFNLGMAYAVLNDHANAAKYFAMAAAQPDPGQEHTNLLFARYAIVQQQRGLFAEGLEVCLQADALNIVQPGVEFARGYCLRGLERYEEAEAAFRLAIELGRDDRQLETMIGDVGLGSFKSRYGLALTLADQERYEEALTEVEATLAECDSMAEAHHFRASLLAQMGRYPEAEAALSRILEFQPEHPEAIRAMGILLFAEQRDSDALPWLRQAAHLFPDDYEALGRLALCCERLGLTQEARETYALLRQISPDSPEVCVNLGRVLAEEGSLPAALNAFADAIELNPHYANAYFNMGDLLYKMGVYDQAAEVYLTGLNIDPEFASGFFVLGNAYFQAGDYSAAAIAFRQALAYDPANNRARHNLALAESSVAKAA